MLIYRIVSISLEIQRIARIVYIILYGFGVQYRARKRFDRSICLRLEKYIKNESDIQR